MRVIFLLWFALNALLRADPLSQIESGLAKLGKHPSEVADVIEEGRLLFWKAKYTENLDERKQLLRQSLAYIEQAKAKEPKNPGALLGWIAAKGELAQVSHKIVALSYVIGIEKEALELERLQPSYSHYAAGRILGRLYQLAPGFISIGSTKKARAKFEAVMAVDPTFPGNQLFYADFLLSVGEKGKARSLATQVLEKKKFPDYPLEEQDWMRMAREICDRAGVP